MKDFIKTGEAYMGHVNTFELGIGAILFLVGIAGLILYARVLCE